MIKGFNVAIYQTIDAYLRRTLERETVYGIEDGAIGYSTFGGHVDSMISQLETVLIKLQSKEIEIPESTSTASTWSTEAAHEFVVRFDGDSCVLSGARDILEGEIVSLMFINETDRAATVRLASGPADVTREMYAKKTVEVASASNALFNLDASFGSRWTVPAAEQYELRSGFEGDPMGRGVVACWASDDSEAYFAELFNVLSK